MNDMAKLIGCMPSYWTLLRHGILFSSLTNTLCGSFYRLRGPGAKTALAVKSIKHVARPEFGMPMTRRVTSFETVHFVCLFLSICSMNTLVKMPSRIPFF